MKKVFSILMVALFVTAAVSCSKDTEDLIIGIWEVTESTYTLTVNGEVQEASATFCTGDVITFTFKDDHTFTIVYRDSVTIFYRGSVENSGTWSVDGDKLIIGDGEETIAYNIDKKNLTISYSESEVEEGISYSASIVMKMKRI